MSNERSLWAALVPSFLAVVASSAYGMEPAARTDVSSKATAVCGVILKAGGKVEIFDPDRTHLLDAAPNQAIPCGGWVSVGNEPGWITIKHRDGLVVTGASGTFFQIQDQHVDPTRAVESVTLYRGQLHIASDSGGTEFRIGTANAMARFSLGRIYLGFSETDEETQLISLEKTATLENRFHGDRRIVVKAGEATTLNFKALRIVPSTPRAVVMSSLKEKLEAFYLDPASKSEAVLAASARVNRKFASEMPKETAHPDSETTYIADWKNQDHGNGKQADPAITRKMVNRMIAGSGATAVPVRPFASRKAKVRIESESGTPAEIREKSRLVEELSKLRTDGD